MRYYEQKYPDVDDLVMVQVVNITEMGASVKLLEYDGLEGLILLSELTRRRVKSMAKLIRVGKNEVVQVVRVDRDKGYIDLSKRKVSGEELIPFKDKYTQARHVNQILRNMSERLGVAIEGLFETIAWPLARQYKNAYEALNHAVHEPEEVYGHLNLEPAVLKELKAEVSRLVKPASNIRANIRVTCSGERGVHAIKEALAAGQALQTEDMPIAIKLVASSEFYLAVTTMERQKGLQLLTDAIEAIQKEMATKQGGECSIHMAPKITNQNDEAELKAMIDKAGQEQDEESEEEEQE